VAAQSWSSDLSACALHMKGYKMLNSLNNFQHCRTNPGRKKFKQFCFSLFTGDNMLNFDSKNENLFYFKSCILS